MTANRPEGHDRLGPPSRTPLAHERAVTNYTKPRRRRPRACGTSTSSSGHVHAAASKAEHCSSNAGLRRVLHGHVQCDSRLYDVWRARRREPRQAKSAARQAEAMSAERCALSRAVPRRVRRASGMIDIDDRRG